ncbi:MAG: signal peptidase I [Dehalococcoidia bacterium]
MPILAEMLSDASRSSDQPEPAPGDDAPRTHAGLDELDPWMGTAAGPDAAGDAAWRRAAGGFLEVLDVIVLALAMLIVVRFVAHNYIVDGPSMQPTFHDGEFVIVNRLAYRSFDFSWLPGVGEDEWRPFGEPQPGDVIVFTQVSSGIPKDLIKRVIAVAGQTVEIRDGAVYLDGQALEEPYISAPPDYRVEPVTVPAGALFVLGDNRINSADSHLFGVIEESQVVGRADLRYWPLGDAGRIEHHLGAPRDVALPAAGAVATGAP